ncbi:hypothetical protein [Sphingopyxis sp.]|uniref:hypothetical protein n=1 Tax=Sphingopyxis sp. TaxID=1908224 RepID=UPI0025E82A89|nr:hypothetical protein [Sphingopyxis sp.]
MMALFVLAAVAAPAPVTIERAPLDRPASTMTNAEIKAYNEGLASTDPNYIKCRKIDEIGSLVKKARVCHSNDEWKKLWVQGNQDSRDTVDHFSSKGSGCPPTRIC